MNKTYHKTSELPAAVPLFPLAGTILLPGGQLPLNIFEPRYLAMFDDAMRGERLIGIIQPSNDTEPPALQPVGAVGRITQLSETGDGRYFVILSGIARFRLLDEIETSHPYRLAHVDFDAYAADLEPEGPAASHARLRSRVSLNDVAFQLAQTLKLDITRKDIESMPDDDMVCVFSMIGPFSPAEKQALLEAGDLAGRADLLLALAEVELARLTHAAKPLQ
jgi:Lon protease-like protein